MAVGFFGSAPESRARCAPYSMRYAQPSTKTAAFGLNEVVPQRRELNLARHDIRFEAERAAGRVVESEIDAGEVAGCHRAPGEGRAGLRLMHLALGIEEIHRGEERTPWRPRITNELDRRASRGSATGPSQSATSQVPTSAAVPDETPADARRSARDNRTRPFPCGSPHRPPERPRAS